MVIKIKIDCREHDLLREITTVIGMNPAFESLQVTSENLPLGDILIEDNDRVCIVIERKTIPDLLSSLRDGRYVEQSYRLNGMEEVPNHNIIYLIEGDSMNNKFFKRIDKKSFYSCMFSLNYKKGFSVMRTQCLSETVFYICNAAMKIKDCDTTKTSTTTTTTTTTLTTTTSCKVEEPSEKDYIHVIKKVKKENITPGNIDEIMLCQIPNVSATIAIAIIEKFGSIKQLILMANKKVDDEDEKEEDQINLLDDIYTVNKNGSKRKISKKAVENIYSFLLK